MLDPVPSTHSHSSSDETRIRLPDEGLAADHTNSFYTRALAEVQSCVLEQVSSPATASFNYLMTHDSLTGLLNRSAFLAELQLRLAPRTGKKQCRGLLIVDLDFFRGVNVGQGIAAGDKALSIVAQRICAGAPSSAVIARLSGVEFAVLADFADVSEAQSAAAELLAELSVPMAVGRTSIEITARIGVSMVRETDTPDRLVSRAGAALHQAKKRGGNRCEMESSAHSDTDDGRMNRRGELRQAIEDGEFCLFYQPQIDLISGQMSGFEALVRWDHPDRGLLAPSAFIDFAEESGLILPLGAWVINAAVAQQVAWHRSASERPPVRMSINISAIQLNDPRLEEMVIEALERHGVAPGLLTLEITEMALTADPDAALRTLEALKALGVRLAIDDFGTGHSSLTYLKRVPIDELKIDRSFIAGLTTDSKDHAIVASCVQLAHATNLIAVAEGVETPAQLLALTELHCDLAQGYFYTRPMSAEDLEPWFIPRPENMRLDESHLVN